MKRAIIAALICANLVLAGALITENLQQAKAQSLTFNAKTNYAITTCVIGIDQEAMLIFDSDAHKLGAFRTDNGGRALVPYTPIDLTREFK